MSLRSHNGEMRNRRIEEPSEGQTQQVNLPNVIKNDALVDLWRQVLDGSETIASANPIDSQKMNLALGLRKSFETCLSKVKEQKARRTIEPYMDTFEQEIDAILRKYPAIRSQETLAALCREIELAKQAFKKVVTTKAAAPLNRAVGLYKKWSQAQIAEGYHLPQTEVEADRLEAAKKNDAFLIAAPEYNERTSFATQQPAKEKREKVNVRAGQMLEYVLNTLDIPQQERMPRLEQMMMETLQQGYWEFLVDISQEELSVKNVRLLVNLSRLPSPQLPSPHPHHPPRHHRHAEIFHQGHGREGYFDERA